MGGRNLVKINLKEDSKEACRFYNRSNGESHRMREKDRNTLNTLLYLEYFVFFPPQRWDEQARTSEAYPIQSLCLRGVGTCSVVKHFIKLDAVAD